MTYYTCMVLLIFRFKCAQFRRALRGFAALRAEVRGEQATRAVTLSRYSNHYLQVYFQVFPSLNNVHGYVLGT